MSRAFHFTDTELAVILNEKISSKEVSKIINRPFQSICYFRRKHGIIKKNFKYIQEYDKLSETILNIMQRESKHYYQDMYEVFGNEGCIRDIIYTIKENVNIRDYVSYSGDYTPYKHFNYLRIAISKWLKPIGKHTDCFCSKESIENRFRANAYLWSERIQYSEALVEDAIVFLEDVAGYTKMYMDLIE